MAGEAKTYTQEELDAIIAERVGEVDGLKANTKKALDEVKAARAKLAAYDGLDPDEAKSWKTKLTELEQQRKADAAGITAETLAKMRQETAAEFDKKFGPVVEENAKLKTEIRGLRLDDRVKAHMGKAGVRAERIDALYRLTSDRFDLTDDNEPMLKGSTKEVPKYIAEELVKEYPEFFAGSGSSGGGATKSAGGAGRTEPIRISNDPASLLANIDALAKGDVTVDTAA